MPGSWRTLLPILLVPFVFAALARGASGSSGVSPAPDDIWLTNVTNNAFTVSWITSVPTTGGLRYREGGDESWTIVQDQRDTAVPSLESGTISLIHYVIVPASPPSALTENTVYEYEIWNGAAFVGQEGQPYTVTTGKVLGLTSPAGSAVEILSTDGSDLGDVIVKITLVDADKQGSPGPSAPMSQLATRTTQNGITRWYVMLLPTNAREPSLQDRYTFTYQLDLVRFDVRSSSGAVGSAEMTIPADGTTVTFAIISPPTATPTSTSTSSPAPTSTPTITVTPSPSATLPPTVTTTPSPTPTATPSPTPLQPHLHFLPRTYRAYTTTGW